VDTATDTAGSDARGPALLARVSPVGVAAYCLVFPVVQIGLIAASNPGYGQVAWAATATAAYAPLYLRQIWYLVGDRRPPHAGWTLAVMTAIIAGATPLAGGWWLPSFAAVAVCLLMEVPWRWSLPAVAVLIAAQVPLAVAVPAASWPDAPAARIPFFAVTLGWRTAAVFIPVWLARAVRQLDAARRELAQDAVLRERLRVDARLRQTLGTALASIAARGQRSAVLAAEGASAGPELTGLIEISRSALADTRQMLRGLSRPSLWAELETAASLLTAAGIQTRLVLPAGEPPSQVSAGFRDELRSTTARLLRAETARTCVLAVTRDSAQVRLDIQVDGRHLSSMEVCPS
jgi:two-component system, NarL family, sensor histidine kinase DesK